ncbi:hypothetical protein [Faecalimicrobium sp. JNUCC 81]
MRKLGQGGSKMDIKILQEFIKEYKYISDLDKMFSTLKAYKKLKNKF